MELGTAHRALINRLPPGHTDMVAGPVRPAQCHRVPKVVVPKMVRYVFQDIFWKGFEIGCSL